MVQFYEKVKGVNKQEMQQFKTTDGIHFDV